MKITLSQHTAAILRSSLPLMESHRGELDAAMARSMHSSGSWNPGRERHELVARALFDMLLDHAGALSPVHELVRLDAHAVLHNQLEIGREHHTGFGDGLAAIMKDVLGPQATPSMLSAWGDAYWTITRMIASTPAALAA